jgi:hypothetical protein
MATTPNFSWPTPDNTDLVKNGALAIRTLGDAIDASLVDLEGGTTDQVLAKNSNTDMDFKWVTSDDANAIQNAIVDAKGDLIAASANDTPARLAVGANDLLLTAASGEATGLKYTGGWTTWTPTWTNLTVGNGSIDARYQQIGKTINYYLYFQLGSTSAVTGRIIYTYPLNPVNAFAGGLGHCILVDNGVGSFNGMLGAWSGTQGFLAAQNTAGTYAGEAATSSTVPFTWTTGDFFFLNSSFEVA